MPEQHTYMVIDMKCFYASVECAERQLNPFETCLVVADETRGPNALCLAISPRMKALGIKNRCRLSDIPKNVKYIIAPPRMQLYIDYAADIYAIYLNYFSPDDIHVYSIDESFLDVTHYLGTYHMTPKQLAKRLMNEIADKLQIPSTAGIGTNLYLAKIALDITAKKAKDHMGYLDEDLYRQTLWDHEPLTDFWQVSTGTVNRLAKYGIHTMRGIAEYPEQYIYKAFGKNAELLIDHAWGRESCEMKDIKNYCHCDCGTEKPVNQRNLLEGKTNSCGCTRSEHMKKIRKKIKGQHSKFRTDLTGQHFGRWTVLGKAEHQVGKHPVWECQCECGAIRAVAHSSLVNGQSQSCGCMRVDMQMHRHYFGSYYPDDAEEKWKRNHKND